MWLCLVVSISCFTFAWSSLCYIHLWQLLLFIIVMIISLYWFTHHFAKLSINNPRVFWVTRLELIVLSVIMTHSLDTFFFTLSYFCNLLHEGNYGTKNDIICFCLGIPIMKFWRALYDWGVSRGTISSFSPHNLIICLLQE